MKNHLLRLSNAALGLLVLTLGLFLPSSCTKEVFNDFEDGDSIEMVITVGADTKTTNSGNSTLWADDDKLTVIHASENGTDYLASQFVRKAGNVFTGRVKRLSDQNDWYVVYPYIEGNNAPDQLSFSFPNTQTQIGNASMAHLAGENFPLFGKTIKSLARDGQLSLPMKNALAIAQFEVKNETGNGPIIVKEIQFTASSPIAGDFKMDITGDAPAFTAEANAATKVVTLTVEEGSEIAEGATSMFNMAVVPFTAQKGSSLIVKVTAVHPNTPETPIAFYRKITAPDEGISFTSGVIQGVAADFDESHSTNPDAGTAGEVDLEVGQEPEDGDYLLVYENGENSMAFAPIESYKGANYALPVSVRGGKVYPKVEGQDLSPFVVNLENTKSPHPNDTQYDAYNVRNSDDYYVFYATAQNTYSGIDAIHILPTNTMEIGSNTYEYFHTFVQAEDGVRIVCSIATGGNKYLLVYNDGFNYIQVPQNGSESDVTGTKLHLFQIGEGSAKQKQELSFKEPIVNKVLGEDCQEGETFNVQEVQGARTSVTYTSSRDDVASIDGTLITVVGTGTTIITATASAEMVDGVEYKEASASYTLQINPPAPDGFISLGTFNLENSHVKAYLDAAATAYTDDNYHQNSGNLTIVTTYTQNESATNRWDIPEPVKLTWTTASTGTATVTVYDDVTLSDSDVVWTWTASSGSKSFDVYNLIPGQTYYCTVVDDNNGEYLLKGTFNTEGRRRMVKISDHTGAGYANNCRDLGGIITADGTKRIKYGMIYRGTNLTNTSKAEQQYMVEFMEIALDNDLRDGGSITDSGGSYANGMNRNNPFKAYYSVGYFPATPNGSYDVIYCGPGYGTSVGSTTGSALTNPLKLYQTMQAFIDCAKAGKASYFHCYIGSDRTGFWGFFLESLLGVSPKESSIDFELTGFAKHATGGNRERNNTGYTYYQGMEYFTGKSYYKDYANDPKHQLQKTVTKYLIDEVGQYIVDNKNDIITTSYPGDDNEAIREKLLNFTQEGFAADIELFKSLLLEDI